VLGDLGADRQAKGAGRACAKRYPRSGPCDLNRTEGTKGRPRRRARVCEAVPAVRAVRSESDGGDHTEGVEWLRAALLLSAA
jgi:hypothetical protein